MLTSKQFLLFKVFSLSMYLLFFSSAAFGQEKRQFLQERYDGHTEIIQATTKEKVLKSWVNDMAREGILLSYSNLKYNSKKEIVRISLLVQNKKSNSEADFNNGHPIPNITVGAINGVATISASETTPIVAADPKIAQKLASLSIKEQLKNPLYFIDDQASTAKEANKLNTSAIASIKILKAKKAMLIYGDKGRNGAILIKTKKN